MHKLYNQPVNQEEQKQQFSQPESKKRRHKLLIALFLVLGFLPVLAWLLATWSGMLHHSAPRSSAAHPREQAAGKTPMQLMPQETSGLPPGQIAAQIDNLLTEQADKQQFSGSVLVAQDGQILLSKGYSMANWSTSTPNTPDTRFFLGSVTKEFTAMAILILQERGKLRVQDPICSHIANCPSPWQPVTIAQVMTHTSGIPELGTDQLSGASPQAWINSFNNAPLQFTPGVQFQYCSTCFQILAYVVQQAAGIPYSQFVQQNILEPLQMSSSGFDAQYYYAQPSSAIGYQTWQVTNPELGFRVDPQWSFLFGSGLLYSTVEDLYRWDQSLSTNVLVSQQSLDQAFTPYVEATLFPGSQYGYGWFMNTGPHRLIWHDGVIDGFRNFNGRYVDDGVTVIFLSNLSALDILPLSHSLEKVIFDEPAGG